MNFNNGMKALGIMWAKNIINENDFFFSAKAFSFNEK